ncbi:hypothetical protein B566_EDAN016698 [Ephemera danica]|nr:hypothetical protein B566_EDAN016698 [Ephemera danica]
MDVFLMIRRKKMTIFTDAKDTTSVHELKKIIEGLLQYHEGSTERPTIVQQRQRAHGGREVIARLWPQRYHSQGTVSSTCWPCYSVGVLLWPRTMYVQLYTLHKMYSLETPCLLYREYSQ